MGNTIDPKAFSLAVDAVKRTLHCLSDLGCDALSCSGESLEILSHWGKPTPLKKRVQSPEGISKIHADWGNCRRCALFETRNQRVFGEGNAHARLMLIGDVPAVDDDRMGRAFMGEPGQLLDNMIKAMGLSREQVYITHVVKCRPPSNRHPLAMEIQACIPCLKKQIAAVHPDVICTLGAIATQALLGQTKDVAGLRGRFHPYGLAKIIPTFHPALLLRKPEHKRQAWEDLKKIMEALGLPGKR